MAKLWDVLGGACLFSIRLFVRMMYYEYLIALVCIALEVSFMLF